MVHKPENRSKPSWRVGDRIIPSKWVDWLVQSFVCFWFYIIWIGSRGISYDDVRQVDTLCLQYSLVIREYIIFISYFDHIICLWNEMESKPKIDSTWHINYVVIHLKPIDTTLSLFQALNAVKKWHSTYQITKWRPFCFSVLLAEFLLSDTGVLSIPT